MKLGSIPGTQAGKSGEWRARLRSFAIYIIIAAVVMGVLGGSRTATEGMERVALSYDILAASEKADAVSEKIVIVMCTDNTVRQLSSVTGWPIDRSYYAALLETAFADAKTVVFDILFADESNSKSDRALSSAVTAHGRVVLARSLAARPIDSLLDTGARVGYALEFAENESDAISRRYKLFVNEDRCTGPTLICAALLQQGYTVEFDGQGSYAITSPDGVTVDLKVDDDGYFYRIPSRLGQNITVIDLYDVYCGRYADGLFDDAVVFVGGSVAGYEDIVHAPDYTADGGKGSATRVMGTKFLADSYLTALSGFGPQRISAVAEGIICALMTLAAAFIAVRLSVRISWAGVAALCGAWFGLARLLFVSGSCYVPAAAPIISAAAAYLLVVVLALLVASREWLVSSVPTEALYHMAYELENVASFGSFEEYADSFSDGIFRRVGARLIAAQTDESDALFRLTAPPRLSADGSGRTGAKIVRTRAVTRRYGCRTLMIIPLPMLDDAQTYTVLGTDRKASANWYQSVTALILAMYVYFKAQKQSAEKQQMALSMITMIIQMIDAKDPVTAGHSRRVSTYSRRLGEWLGFDRKRAADLEFAALLHDVGKIGVEDAVLNKAGIFTEADFAQMKLHPVRGAEIVRTVGLPDDIVDGVLHHHERLDGKGYPDGTDGGSLTDFAKIIKVADVYDALTSRRQYKSAWGARRAFDMITRGIGTEFDKDIAETFIKNMAPADYVPFEGDITSDGSYSTTTITKSASFARLLWDSASQPVMTKRNTMSRLRENFRFDCDRLFAGIEWGERFGTSRILKNLPSILHYDEPTDSTIIALRGPREGLVNNIICYFRKGCLSAGIVTLRPGNLEAARAELTNTYGSPRVIDGDTVWEGRAHLAIQFAADSTDMIAYITGYLSNEI